MPKVNRPDKGKRSQLEEAMASMPTEANSDSHMVRPVEESPTVIDESLVGGEPESTWDDERVDDSGSEADFTQDAPDGTTPPVAEGDAPLPELKLYCKGAPNGPLTAHLMRNVLGWENEDDYKVRMGRDQPDSPPETRVFFTDADIARGKTPKGQPIPANAAPVVVLLKDHKERRIVCHKNDNNRPFDEGHCKKLCQEILTRRWAGPTTMPGETVNGEAIITSWATKVRGFTDPKSIVINGQHTGSALILAWEMWADDKEDERVHGKWREFWPPDQYPDGPVIDKVVVTGVSPNPCVVRTLDNTKPRSLADTIYTSDVFINRPDSEKKEASRMLSAAINFLWTRLRVGGTQEGFLKKLYQTHATSHDWLARHPRLLKCVEHLFIENRGRVISECKLSAGECAAVMYIQGSATSSQQDYHAQEETSEKTLKWDLWEKAAKFWSKLANAEVYKEGKEKGEFKDREAYSIRKALIAAIEEETLDEEGNDVKIDQKGSARRTAKLVVLSKAWALYKDGKRITQELVTPKYRTTDTKAVLKPDGSDPNEETPNDDVPSVVTLDEESLFGGIDLGDVKGKEKSAGVKDLTEENIQKGAVAVVLAGVKLANEAAAKTSMGAKSPAERFLQAKEKYGKDRILLFMPKGGKRLVAYNEDADILAEECACDIALGNGVRFTHQAIGDADEITRQLLNAGYQVGTIQELSEIEDKVALHNPMKRKLPKMPPHPTL